MERTNQNNDINAINEARELLNELRRSNLSHDKTKKTRDKLHKNEADYNFLKEKEQNDSLTTE